MNLINKGSHRFSVIGGSGFIGSALSNNAFRKQMSFKIIDLQKSKNHPTETVICDVRDVSSLITEVSGNVVVNLAAVHRDDVTDPNEYYSTNVEGARVLCEVCEEKGINKIVFTSSVAVYGFAAPGTGKRAL